VFFPTITGISHLVIEVSDLERSRRFCELLGFVDTGLNFWPDCKEAAAFKTASGQHVVLCWNPQPASPPETGVHQAYRVSVAGREAIAEKLRRQSVEVHDYKEDRPAEASDNFYFDDPDGNRIQLVASNNAPAGVQAIDHAAVEVVDIEWAEDFYVNLLGLPVDCRVGWRTEDYLRAKLWGEGKEAMAPGTRRWDKRYTVMEQKRLLPRPNTHFFVRAGEAVLGIYLATQHRQEPPEEQPVGTPRTALATDSRGIETVAKALEESGKPTAGPKTHPASAPIASSLYFKDPGGNFLELCVLR
jgi:catechol-2,3-dioxygenase